MKTLIYRNYSILLILYGLTNSIYCMTPSPEFAELLRGSTAPYSSVLSGIASGETTRTPGPLSGSAESRRSVLSSLLLPTTQVAATGAPGIGVDGGNTTLALPSMWSELPDLITLVPTDSSSILSNTVPDSLIFPEAEKPKDKLPTGYLQPVTTKDDILKALRDLGKSKVASTHDVEAQPFKKPRVDTAAERTAFSFLAATSQEHSSTADKVINIQALIEMIGRGAISTASDLAKFIRINKTCHKIFNGMYLINYLPQLKGKNINAYLDIAAHKNFMPLINKHMNEREKTIATLKPKDPTELGKVTTLYNKEIDALVLAAIRYNNLAVIRSIHAQNPEIFDNKLYLNFAISKGRHNIVIFLLSHDKDLYNTCLLQTGYMERSILHYVIFAKNNSLLRQILELIANKIEDKDKYNKIVNATNHIKETILHLAATQNNSEAIKICLSFFKDLALKDTAGSTALHVACRNNNSIIAKDLLSSLAEPELIKESMKPDIAGDTPLSYAVQHNNGELITILLKFDPMNHKDGMGKTLAWALINKNIKLFETLLNLYPSKYKSEMINDCLKATNKIETTDLQTVKFLIEKCNADFDATKILVEFINFNKNKDCPNIIEYLISKGAIVNDTILQAALYSDDVLIIKKVSECIDITSVDSDGNTILHKYASIHDPAVIRALISLGVDPKIKNNLGQTALHLSIREQLNDNEDKINIDVLKVLIEHGCDVNEQDNQGNTPLFYIGYLFNENVLVAGKYLLAVGANLEHKNNNGETWINYLLKSNHHEGYFDDIKEFVKLKCNLNTPDVHGNIPLHNYFLNTGCYSDAGEHIAAMELLVKSGSNIEAKNLDGNTPFHIFISNLKETVTEEFNWPQGVDYKYGPLEEFIKLFTPSFIIRNNEGNRPYDIAVALANTEKYISDAKALQLLLKITQLIKPT